MPRRTIILYGQSMLLSLIAASLAENLELYVLEAGSWEEICAFAQDCPPDVFIYDLAAASSRYILPLLSLNPNMLLIGLDTETNRALLISGKETKSLTLNRVKDIASSIDPVF